MEGKYIFLIAVGSFVVGSIALSLLWVCIDDCCCDEDCRGARGICQGIFCCKYECMDGICCGGYCREEKTIELKSIVVEVKPIVVDPVKKYELVKDAIGNKNLAKIICEY